MGKQSIRVNEGNGYSDFGASANRGTYYPCTGSNSDETLFPVSGGHQGIEDG